MTDTVAFDEAKAGEFLGKALDDLAGANTVLLCGVGDRLGLFKELDANGPATSEELSRRAGIDERYAREWLGGMSAAGYLSYDPANKRFTLPAEHAAVLAQEGHAVFFGGLYEQMLGMSQVVEPLLEAFRHGGGVPQSAYAPEHWSGLERGTAAWFDNSLVQTWIPAVPDVEAALQRGIDVADVGCGAGRALIRLAEAYPNSRYVGFDNFPGQVERAREAVEAAGLTDKIQFEVADAAQGLPDSYDLITTFDVIHDSADPLGLLTAIHEALRPDGHYLCLDINCSDKLEENAGPLATLMFGASVFYCMTTSLAQGGAGLGTLGLHQKKMRELATEAGFSSVDLAEIDNPFNVLYVLKP
ncbi:MAG TPA: methyltransferase domain-containing protein [Actinomycetota bacterium]|jgi:SAM-dependent methyltransferase|nr:methyltransferase domain-containing protein [Actinomycetota bacterium]